ncbi:3-dehydroquinate synthase [Vagococcus coleopterorum]|uniref:3-dehydroquinate synthase n=1 Tax=Vagococcus coleopterorum TaxID=2714946 RepID=A0A6G8ANI7_9ENTE|nr:3-dehydroquinate synthase [Vagococcus coleopterorum]QIL46557.1 3-dehydroquinate synthase [Vagococcus coleopterorum]
MNVSVNLPNESYQISIEKGLLSKCGSWLSKIWSTDKKVAIISDEEVASFYLDKVCQSVEEAGYRVVTKTISAGEASKSFTRAEELCQWLAEENMTRTDGVVALGGGVVGDLVGFVAGIYMRGISYVQMPTSLLAQVDSSVGGKTAVNTVGIKNLVGVFNQPAGVLIDPQTLTTLPRERISEGLAEVVKTAAILDVNLWTDLQKLNSIEDFLNQSESIIARCCELKASVVEADEKEAGQRVILNFGHTFGHAVEATLQSRGISHGEAVAIGMVRISEAMISYGYTPKEFMTELTDLLTKFELPITMSGLDAEAIITAMSGDKKNKGNALRLVYVSEIGNAKTLDVSFETVKDYIRKELNA